LTTGLTDGALLWQVACEFVAASRKLAPFGFSHAQSYGKLISEDDEPEVRSDVQHSLGSFRLSDKPDDGTQVGLPIIIPVD